MHVMTLQGNYSKAAIKFNIILNARYTFRRECQNMLFSLFLLFVCGLEKVVVLQGNAVYNAVTKILQLYSFLVQ